MSTVATGVSAEIVILDVGHGNSALIRQGTRAVVVDAPPGKTLFEELERCGITDIAHLVLSHSDQDHIGGAVKLLADTRFNIGMIWYNPDGIKQSRVWQSLARQAFLRQRQGLLVGGQRNLNSASDSDLTFSPNVGIAVLHPDLEMATLGPSGGRTPVGVLTANTVSAVLQVSLNGESAVLLSADIDAVALRRMLDLGTDIRARVLVFPHHGGQAGTSASRQFARDLCTAVEPDLVLFSMARGGRFDNPDPEMVAGVRDAAPQAHIACTQLSSRCHQATSVPTAAHLGLHAAAGNASGTCCAGTVVITHTGVGLKVTPSPDDHRVFVDLVEDPLCRRNTAALPAQRLGP